jgi:hypothetical protein
MKLLTKYAESMTGFRSVRLQSSFEFGVRLYMRPLCETRLIKRSLSFVVCQHAMCAVALYWIGMKPERDPWVSG